MKTPETNEEVTVPQVSTKLRAAVLKQLRKATSFYLRLSSPRLAQFSHAWEKIDNLEVSPLEGKEKSITRV